MPPLSDLPGEIKRKKFLKALERLNFIISLKGGKGSHCKVECPNNRKIITIPDDPLTKNRLKYILDEIAKYSSIKWDDIKKNL